MMNGFFRATHTEDSFKKYYIKVAGDRRTPMNKWSLTINDSIKEVTPSMPIDHRVILEELLLPLELV